MEEFLLCQYFIKLATEYPWAGMILSGLGSLVVIAQVIVPLTPTEKDDEVLAWIMRGFSGKILRGLISFAPIQKPTKKT